jgi:hypothetical protein
VVRRKALRDLREITAINPSRASVKTESGFCEDRDLKLCAFLASCIQTLLKPTVCLLLRRRCTRRRPILPTPTENVAVTDQLGEAFATKYDRLLSRRLPRERVQSPNSTHYWPAKARRWRHRLAVRLAQVAYLRPSKIRQSLGLDRKRPQQADRFIESFHGCSGDRATFTTYSGVIHRAIESAEPFYGEFQQRFGVGRACGVRSVKRDVRAQFYFESFPFFARKTTKNHFGAFFDETSDDPFSYPSGTAGNDNLIF